MNQFLFVLLFVLSLLTCSAEAATQRFLYVANPGIRNYVEYGGHGLLVYDMDNEHKFVKRIPTAGLDENGKPINVKGVCASVSLKRIYISTLRTLTAVDLETEKIVWEKAYDGGCDRMAISPDGKTIYLPSLEKDHWHVVDGETGAVIKRLDFPSGAHNTIFGPDGKQVYLAGLRNTYLNVANTADHSLGTPVGPFGGPIRPFTTNGSQTLCFVNVNGLLGFEVGDLKTGKKLHRVEVQGFKLGAVKRHGCPSHGVGMTPDEKEIWVTDAANSRMHIYDATVMPPKQLESVELRDQPGWITFSLDGKFAYPSTLDVVDVKSRKILYVLKDENGQPIQSEKVVEIHFDGKTPVKAGDQFGIGRKMK